MSCIYIKLIEIQQTRTSSIAYLVHIHTPVDVCLLPSCRFRSIGDAERVRDLCGAAKLRADLGVG